MTLCPRSAKCIRKWPRLLPCLMSNLCSLWGQTAKMRIIGAFDTVEANIKYVCDTMNVHPGADQISNAVEIRMKYIRLALRPRPDADSTLRQLKEQSYKIGLAQQLLHRDPYPLARNSFC